MTLQLRFPLRQPSEELLNLIKEVSSLARKLSELFEAVKQKAHEEGFTDYEIRDMVRTHLKGSFTTGQIKWYLYEKDKYHLKTTSRTSQVEGNKVIEQDPKSIELRSKDNSTRRCNNTGLYNFQYCRNNHSRTRSGKRTGN